MDETSPKSEAASLREELSVLTGEYGALKSEQSSRIGFRDNLLYVTVGAVGGVSSVSLTGLGQSGPMPEALLVIPWVTTILGWTYLVNDQKITSIRRYIEDDLGKRVRRLVKMRSTPFAWEGFHRMGEHQKLRKKFQLFIDLLTFVCSAAVALVVFVVHAIANRPEHLFGVGLLVVVEAVLVFLLFLQFLSHAREASRPRQR